MPTHRNHDKQPTVSVLLSGGIDSAACVAFYLEQQFSVSGLFVDYGQAATRREARAAKAIARHYQIPLQNLRWLGLHKKDAGFIAGRNAFLLIAVLMELDEHTTMLALGIHSGTRYPDCTSQFVRQMQGIFDAYTQGRVQIGVPFLKWTKGDIWTFCHSRGVPLRLTYSCERGLDQPCGKCNSCRDLETQYARS